MPSSMAFQFSNHIELLFLWQENNLGPVGLMKNGKSTNNRVLLSIFLLGDGCKFVNLYMMKH